MADTVKERSTARALIVAIVGETRAEQIMRSLDSHRLVVVREQEWKAANQILIAVSDIVALERASSGSEG
jgi:hypothetical protein